MRRRFAYKTHTGKVIRSRCILTSMNHTHKHAGRWGNINCKQFAKQNAQVNAVDIFTIGELQGRSPGRNSFVLFARFVEQEIEKCRVIVSDPWKGEQFVDAHTNTHTPTCTHSHMRARTKIVSGKSVHEAARTKAAHFRSACAIIIHYHLRAMRGLWSFTMSVCVCVWWWRARTSMCLSCANVCVCARAA